VSDRYGVRDAACPLSTEGGGGRGARKTCSLSLSSSSFSSSLGFSTRACRRRARRRTRVTMLHAGMLAVAGGPAETAPFRARRGRPPCAALRPAARHAPWRTQRPPQHWPHTPRRAAAQAPPAETRAGRSRPARTRCRRQTGCASPWHSPGSRWGGRGWMKLHSLISHPHLRDQHVSRSPTGPRCTARSWGRNIRPDWPAAA